MLTMNITVENSFDLIELSNAFRSRGESQTKHAVAKLCRKAFPVYNHNPGWYWNCAYDGEWGPKTRLTIKKPGV